jgi:hypothetical protein
MFAGVTPTFSRLGVHFGTLGRKVGGLERTMSRFIEVSIAGGDLQI